MVVFVVKRYAVREANMAESSTRGQNWAVRSTQGGCHPHIEFILRVQYNPFRILYLHTRRLRFMFQ